MMKKTYLTEAGSRTAYQSLSLAYDRLEDEITQRWQFQYEQAAIQLDKNEQTIMRLEDQLEIAKQQASYVADIESELMQIKNSRSWRITAPLRRVLSMLR